MLMSKLLRSNINQIWAFNFRVEGFSIPFYETKEKAAIID